MKEGLVSSFFWANLRKKQRRVETSDETSGLFRITSTTFISSFFLLPSPFFLLLFLLANTNDATKQNQLGNGAKRLIPGVFGAKHLARLPPNYSVRYGYRNTKSPPPSSSTSRPRAGHATTSITARRRRRITTLH